MVKKCFLVLLILHELNITAIIEKVERCGKIPATQPGGPPPTRLLKLYMATQGNRKEILQNAKKLRDSTDEHTKNNIYIRPDLTIKQQLEQKNLRDHLREKRAQNPTKNYRIIKGVVTEVQEE